MCSSDLWSPSDDEQDHLRRQYLVFLGEHPDALSRDCRVGHLTASALVVNADRDRVPAWPQARERDRHAIGADAEEHGVGEGNDAGVAQQQVETRRQHDEDADLGRDVQRLGAGKQERRQREPDQARPTGRPNVDQRFTPSLG